VLAKTARLVREVCLAHEYGIAIGVIEVQWQFITESIRRGSAGIHPALRSLKNPARASRAVPRWPVAVIEHRDRIGG
jgi:hypothetical protein